MPPERTFNYEAMFLIGQSTAADLASVITHIDELLARSEAKLISMAKWDERRLAYEIDKQKRGLYIIAYIEAPAQKISQLDRDCQLSETIMRLLLTRADHLTLEEMQAADGREALMGEAKLRADKANEAEEEGKDTGVRMGRPVEDTPSDHSESRSTGDSDSDTDGDGDGDGGSDDGDTTEKSDSTEPANA
ncbi:MAG: 30S ribosomal protein S6 [Phycisphaera sp.]|nr:MAG: 30S ribosomal protein S6 [Phycisphaera sp.]